MLSVLLFKNVQAGCYWCTTDKYFEIICFSCTLWYIFLLICYTEAVFLLYFLLIIVTSRYQLTSVQIEIGIQMIMGLHKICIYVCYHKMKFRFTSRLPPESCIFVSITIFWKTATTCNIITRHFKTGSQVNSHAGLLYRESKECLNTADIQSVGTSCCLYQSKLTFAS